MGNAASAAPMEDGPASRLLAYLRDLDRGDGRRVLSGQHADIWNADPWSTAQPMEVVDPLAPETGNNPSILGLVLNYATNSGAYEVSVSEALANLWWSKGGLVLLSLYDNDPTHSYNSTGAPIGRPIPSAAFHSLTDEYSAAYRRWHSQLDTYAAALHALTDSGRVVLFRPFIEINGNWNWYGAEDPADFIAIWRDMHDYLTLTKGVRNLLWGTGKPIIIPEIGLGYAAPPDHTRDDRVIIDSIKGAYPDVVGFVVFNGSFAICNQNDAAALMNDPWVIDLAELPREP